MLDALPGSRWPEGLVEEPPAGLQTPWPHTAGLGAESRVVVRLDEVPRGTRVELTHDGLGEGPAWDEAVGGYFAAWLQALAALGLLVESGIDCRASAARRGRERYFASAEVPAVPDAAWRALCDRRVRERWHGGALDGTAVLEAVEGRFLRLGAGGGAGVPEGPGGAEPAGREVTLILRPTPRGTHLALAEYGVSGHGPSTRWPPFFERLARFLG